MTKFESVLENKIVVCTGSGGVGKTSISASIALRSAQRGARTIVVTIDPAKRLATSLGLEELSNEPKRLPAPHLHAAGFDDLPLDAMMLDTKSTFDQLVVRYARDDEKARRILSNRFYQAISGALSGTNEYMAMEKLFELSAEDKYDLIVIDTPPTRNALDFVEAPKRLTSFLEGRLLKWFLLPAIGGGRGLFKAMNLAATAFLRIVQRIVGAQVVKDTAEFFLNFEGMYDGFKQRAQEVYDLLRDPKTAFLVVTAPTEQSVEEAMFFASTLNEHGLAFEGLIVNRTHPRFDLPSLEPTGSAVVDSLLEIAANLHQIAESEEASLQRLEDEISIQRWAWVPYLTREVVDLPALDEVAGYLFDEPANPVGSQADQA